MGGRARWEYMPEAMPPFGIWRPAVGKEGERRYAVHCTAVAGGDSDPSRLEIPKSCMRAARQGSRIFSRFWIDILMNNDRKYTYDFERALHENMNYVLIDTWAIMR